MRWHRYLLERVCHIFRSFKTWKISLYSSTQKIFGLYHKKNVYAAWSWSRAYQHKEISHYDLSFYHYYLLAKDLVTHFMHGSLNIILPSKTPFPKLIKKRIQITNLLLMRNNNLRILPIIDKITACFMRYQCTFENIPTLRPFPSRKNTHSYINWLESCSVFRYHPTPEILPPRSLPSLNYSGQDFWSAPHHSNFSVLLNLVCITSIVTLLFFQVTPLPLT
jgi:hypothetical protein